MTKLMTFLLALLVVMQVVAGMVPWGMPDSSLMNEESEFSDNKKIYVENRAIASRIYTFDSDRLTNMYEELSFGAGGERSICGVTVDGSNTYFVRVYKGNASWEIMKLAGNRAEKLLEGSFGEDMRVTALAAKEDNFWITTVDANEQVSVFECGESAEPMLKLLLPNVWPQRAARARFDGEQLYLTVEQGDEYIITLGGEISHTGKIKEEHEQPELQIDTKAWLACKKSLFVLIFFIWLVLAAGLIATALICKRAKRLSTSMTAVGGAILLLMTVLSASMVFFRTVYANGIGAAMGSLLDFAMFGLPAWLVGIVVLNIFSRKLTKPMKQMVRQMEGIAEGRIKTEEIPRCNNELHDMGQSIQELCMSLSIQSYELTSTVKAYHRFIPQKLTELLERANIAEISLGDNRRITGDVGLFSVGNRAAARAGLNDDAFVDFINLSLDIYQNSIRDNRGCMISSGLRLSTLETLFTDSASDGVRAGLDFLGQAQRINEKGIPAPQPMLILHRASFLYGIAGENDRLYPYLSSAEFEFLGSFSEKFYEAGVRIVATESYFRQIKNGGFTARHIGFVSDGEREAYKLYEILDTYSVLERNIRLGYDQRFQEALNLFYRNDFFLARNIFSTLLRACPEDGIVRWYMFACENLFNADKNTEIDYSLFGESEL